MKNRLGLSNAECCSMQVTMGFSPVFGNRRSFVVSRNFRVRRDNWIQIGFLALTFNRLFTHKNVTHWGGGRSVENWNSGRTKTRGIIFETMNTQNLSFLPLILLSAAPSACALMANRMALHSIRQEWSCAYLSKLWTGLHSAGQEPRQWCTSRAQKQAVWGGKSR